MTFIIMFALSYLNEPQGLIGFIAESIKHSENAAEPVRPGTMHLWFLYYLLGFSLLATCLTKLRALSFRNYQPKAWVSACFPLILVPAVTAAGVPLPAPESFIPTWWPVLFYGSFFWGGWKLHAHPQLLERLDHQLLPLTILSIVGYGIYYRCMPELNLSMLTNAASTQPLWERIAAVVLTAYLSVSLTIIALLLGKRFLAQPRKPLRLIADSSYWMYLIHLPLVLFLQTLLTPLNWPLWLKLTATVTGTFIPCFASYLVFVRYTPIGWLLHGKREFP
jgi:peptidoglycan/LPS O-acetylase OafA/YrhL